MRDGKRPAFGEPFVLGKLFLQLIKRLGLARPAVFDRARAP
jgi:hypothetical protein